MLQAVRQGGARVLGSLLKHWQAHAPRLGNLHDVSFDLKADGTKITGTVVGLIRNPAFPQKVNDIAVEGGNSLYQSLLDRYIAGEDVPLSEAHEGFRTK